MPVNVSIIRLLSESSPSALTELNVNERIPLYCKYFLLTILHVSFYLSPFYYVSLYFPRLHNKFTIRSAKGVFSFASGKRRYQPFSRHKCTSERVAKQLHYNFLYCSRMLPKKKTRVKALRLTLFLTNTFFALRTAKGCNEKEEKNRFL